MPSNNLHFTREDMRRRTDAFFSFCEQQGWPAPTLQQPAPLRGRYYYSVTNGSDFALIWFSSAGGIDVNASEGGAFKSKLLQWIEQEQPNSAALRRERTAQLLPFASTKLEEPLASLSALSAEQEIIAMDEQATPSGPEPSQPWMFGGHLEPVRLPWTWATERLREALNYWIATTRPDGNPHSRPVWGVWLEGAFYFSTGSLAAQNMAVNPAITVHLESGSDVVIIEGVAEPVNDTSLVEQVVSLYNQKYHWELDPQQLPGPFYTLRPEVAFGWFSDETGLDRGSAFHGTATRWRFQRSPAHPSSQR